MLNLVQKSFVQVKFGGLGVPGMRFNPALHFFHGMQVSYGTDVDTDTDADGVKKLTGHCFYTCGVQMYKLRFSFGSDGVMATDISDGYNPWIFCNPSSVVNFFDKMENAVVAVIYNCLLYKLT